MVAIGRVGSLSPTPELRTTKELVETIDDFVAVQSLLVQQLSTSINTRFVIHLKSKHLKIEHLRSLTSTALGADRRLPKLLLILHTSNGFNNVGNLLFAQS